MVNSQFTENESCETTENSGISKCLSSRSNITLGADDTKDTEKDTDEVEDALNEFRNISGKTCFRHIYQIIQQILIHPVLRLPFLTILFLTLV